MSSAWPAAGSLPDAALKTLHDLQYTLGADFRVWQRADDGSWLLVHPGAGKASDGPPGEGPEPGAETVEVVSRSGGTLIVALDGASGAGGGMVGADGPGPLELARRLLQRALDHEDEVRFFTYELSERYEEINLLYSISETLGSVLTLDDASAAILREVCDVLGARRGSLWVVDSGGESLALVASVGDPGIRGPLRADDPLAVTSQVFRDGRPMILTRETRRIRLGMRGDAPLDGDDGLMGAEPATGVSEPLEEETETVLSVPIRYSPPSGEARTVGVINLFGRTREDRFSASDQKLLAAIASQVGAALENNRLIQESLNRERMAREMELAHNLQMKLVPAFESQDDLDMAARVQPAEQVGGDFYHVIRLPNGKIGVMIGDVSTHGFPAALMMTLAMSAGTIFASAVESPDLVLRQMDDALREELETTEMYLTLFYGVLDPARGRLVYSNAGHPHAFILPKDGAVERLEATDPPMGFAGPESYQERSVSIGPDDLMLLFTDGLSDTLATAGPRSGEDVVVAEAAALRSAPAGEVVDALFSLTEQVTPVIPADDRTAVVVRCAPRGEGAGAS
jgi:sigma-B regulation protein RsbU (phosphoserine phosphatase)